METTPYTEIHTPETLIGAVRFFADEDKCFEYVCAIKWPGGEVCCPECGTISVGKIKSRRLFQCREKQCRKQFSAKVGTIFEDSPLPLSKWLVAVWCIVNARNGVSSCELARSLGITQKSAWHMLHRIRLAMQTPTYRKIRGEVETDESFVGGRLKFMHKHKQAKVKAEFGPKGMNKTVVQGMFERGGELRTQVVPNSQARFIHPGILKNVEPGSLLYSDIATHYHGLEKYFRREVVNHLYHYAIGINHVNTLEGFWSLIKRTIRGTYVAVSPKHLDRYLDEMTRRFNLRDMPDGDRFRFVMTDILGRRLKYAELVDAQ
ncbi:MAG: IS1595 family transposase [Planctomycetota bacterium]|nr:IS1595 family transposase [Planctomycetota bacterium]